MKTLSVSCLAAAAAILLSGCSQTSPIGGAAGGVSSAPPSTQAPSQVSPSPVPKASTQPVAHNGNARSQAFCEAVKSFDSDFLKIKALPDPAVTQPVLEDLARELAAAPDVEREDLIKFIDNEKQYFSTGVMPESWDKSVLATRITSFSMADSRACAGGRAASPEQVAQELAAKGFL